MYEIGRAVEREVRRGGFSVLRNLSGTASDARSTRKPNVPNFADPAARERLTAGLVITIEPIIAAGSGSNRLANDVWTIRTSDGSLAGHYEHTVVITKGQPVLLTAA